MCLLEFAIRNFPARRPPRWEPDCDQSSDRADAGPNSTGRLPALIAPRLNDWLAPTKPIRKCGATFCRRFTWPGRCSTHTWIYRVAHKVGAPQVLPSQNLSAIRQAREEGGNKHFEVDELPGSNHLFHRTKNRLAHRICADRGNDAAGSPGKNCRLDRQAIAGSR
jgi:hypothetical protein